MFKKIEIWILYLVILLGIPVTIFFGILVRQELIGSVKLGRISKTALFLSEIPKNTKNIIKTLTVGDNSAPNRFPSLNGFDGIPNLNESYLLLSRFNGDSGDALVELVNLKDFKVLHTWNPDIDLFNKSIKKTNEFKFLNRDNKNSRQSLYHPKLTRDNGLLFNSGPFRKIDACSNLIFQNVHDYFHHSIETDLEGNIWVPSTMYPQSLPIRKVGVNSKLDFGYVDDAIVKLSPDGEVIFEKSVSQIFIDNGLEYLLFAMGSSNFELDPIHLNDIQPVDFDGKFWEKGDVFLSLRNQSMVLLYRPLTNKIIWKATGPFFHQHDVDIINEHKITIFNNNNKKLIGGDFVDGNNEVLIYDFESGKFSSYLKNSLKENDLRAGNEGRSQVLPNGDLLVEESGYGRIVYFNADGSLRWTYVNKAGNGTPYSVAWSRILYTEKDIKTANNFLQSRIKCDD